MSLSQLEQSLKSQRARPRCVRVNLRLWYALTSANLVAQREAPMSDPELTGLRLPYLGDVLLVLDPDLQSAAFAIEEGVPVQVPPASQLVETQPAPRTPLPVKRPDSVFEGRWMGRY
ncbi:hypothetical protein [Hydrogenophaga sp. PAMC20947]|uniref:hypothetical protein n=1 Tax=Hydrogenophaga sp. PAMC20947 TaxID=2565558 RepID=UPI00109D8384|nr:hypothetical protein [Hydrogenophaga sp. PAMC20947]QCB47919.1 hypothetical protein E5678_18915 [Hydrogenophaga sp. PAMC20947]